MDRLGSVPNPVAFVTARQLTAFDAHDGRLLYATPLELPPAKGQVHLVRYQDDWVVAFGKTVVFVHADTGTVQRRLDLTFIVRTALAHDGALLFAGEGGTACYRDGAMRWSSRHDWAQATVSDGDGAVIARMPMFTNQHIAIGFGSAVAQPGEI